MLHLSSVEIEKLSPRTPRNPSLWEDAQTPRVSAAPTLIGCLKALVARKGSSWFVYRIESEPDILCPPVADGEQTGEVWYLREVEVVLVKKIVADQDYTTERMCSCGSGVPWTQCGDSGYCG